jgi:hypothetical protein
METTTEFINKLGISDLHSFTLCLQAYNDSASIRSEEISHIGYNNQTGYVGIELENGIRIASCFGRPVEYITTTYEQDEDTDYETFHETYDQALNYINN